MSWHLLPSSMPAHRGANKATGLKRVICVCAVKTHHTKLLVTGKFMHPLAFNTRRATDSENNQFTESG